MDKKFTSKNLVFLLIFGLLCVTDQTVFGMKRKSYEGRERRDHRASKKRRLNDSSPHNIKITHKTLVDATQRESLYKTLADNSHKILYFSHYSDTKHIEAKTLESLIEKCKNLAGLYLPSCKNITIETFKKIFYKLINPDCFFYLGLGEDNSMEANLLTTVISKLKNLKSLLIQNGKQITNYTLFAIAQSCKSIKSVHLRDCSHITDKDMLRIINSCHNLINLSIHKGYQLTDEAFQNATFANLRTFHLYDCPKISDKGVETILKTNKNLTQCGILWCPKITDKTIKIIATNLKKLSSLDLTKTGITDIGLGMIGFNCKTLHTLAINRCPNITDYGIRFVLSNIPNLNGLYATNCSNIKNKEAIEVVYSQAKRPIVILS